MMYVIGAKLRILRNGKGMSQQDVADRLDMTASAYGYYEQGKNTPTLDAISKLADLFEVSVDFLLDRSKHSKITPSMSKSNKIITVPVLGKIPAGVPIEAIENITDYEEIVVPQSSSEKEYFCLTVSGDSMSPLLNNNDVVVCKKQADVETGEIAAVIINGYEATLKRVNKQSDGILLVPYNPAYETKFYSAKDIEEVPILILGKVIESRRKF